MIFSRGGGGGGGERGDSGFSKVCRPFFWSTKFFGHIFWSAVKFLKKKVKRAVFGHFFGKC